MAGIDKIYGTEKQLLEFREWLTEHKPEYLYSVNDPADEYYRSPESEDSLLIISNFPTEADVWLYDNCPFTYITDRIHDQYNGKPSL